jgi:hypothetical protein
MDLPTPTELPSRTPEVVDFRSRYGDLTGRGNGTHHVDVSDVLHEMHMIGTAVAPSTDELVAAAVKIARTAGLSWDAIGRVLGTTEMAARVKYSFLDRPEVHGLSG